MVFPWPPAASLTLYNGWRGWWLAHIPLSYSAACHTPGQSYHSLLRLPASLDDALPWADPGNTVDTQSQQCEQEQPAKCKRVLYTCINEIWMKLERIEEVYQHVLKNLITVHSTSQMLYFTCIYVGKLHITCTTWWVLPEVVLQDPVQSLELSQSSGSTCVSEGLGNSRRQCLEKETLQSWIQLSTTWRTQHDSLPATKKCIHVHKHIHAKEILGFVGTGPPY